MATVAITNGHKVVVAILFETAANPVHISCRILYNYSFAVLYVIYNYFPVKPYIKGFYCTIT